MRLELKQDIRQLIVFPLTGALVSYSGLKALEAGGFDIPPELIKAAPAAGACFSWGMVWLGQAKLTIPQLRRRKQSRLEMAHAVWQPHLSFFASPIHHEYIYSGLGIPAQVPESELARFVEIAARRQINARYGERVQGWASLPTDTGLGHRVRQLRMNMVVSRSYFLDEVRPRFAPDIYNGCLHILLVTKLLLNYRQGTGGRLIKESSDWLADQARARWDSLLSQYQERRGNGRFFQLGQVLGSNNKLVQVV